MYDLTKLLKKQELANTDDAQLDGDNNFKTKDYVYLHSVHDEELNDFSQNALCATDYAIINGIKQNFVERSDGTKTVSYWLRDAHSPYHINKIYYLGEKNVYSKADDKSLGIVPIINLDLSFVLKAQECSSFFNIQPYKNNKGETLYYTMQFGEYPQELEKNYKKIQEKFEQKNLVATGKKYCGEINSEGKFVTNIEYSDNFNKYVRAFVHLSNDSVFYDKQLKKYDGDYVWIKVKPLNWKILNWKDLPKTINPSGTGIAKSVKLQTTKAIISGIPFYPESGKNECTMWQNSAVRAYLNGYNLRDELKNGNGNKNFCAKINFDFHNAGFLTEIYDKNIENVLSIIKNDVSITNLSRIGKLNPDKTPFSQRRKMTYTEIIKSWIDAGQSVLLRGPSGIGKTERIKKLYPNHIYIKLTNNMFPEKVVGSMNLQTGQSIPPDFAKEAILACATEEERKLVKENIQNLYDLADTIYERSRNEKEKVVILLDELLNVKPAVQSLVYTLVLNKLVETGKGLKLPANTVVVATGNQKKYSSVAEDIAEPLEKRFDHVLDMKPKVGEWLMEYAIPNNLHPSLIGYIFNKYQENKYSEEISNMGYFYEEPEVGEDNLDEYGCRGKTNDPRSWCSISNTLYAFEEDLQKGKFVGKDVDDLLKVTLQSKLREEWSEEFFDFYNTPTITVQEVVNKKYTQADLPKDINEKFATMSGLLSANEKEVKVCREFIRQYCDPEYLSVYDIYWAGNDENRMELLVELKENNLPGKISLKNDAENVIY